jgi:transcriptional regulator with XRE-family HTH domain
LQTKRIYKGGRRSTACKAEEIGERVRFFRLERGWSQMELAEGICSAQLISFIETGRAGTTVDTLVKIADKLMVPLHEIYQETDGDFRNEVKLDLVEAYLIRNELESAEEMLAYLKKKPDLRTAECQRWGLLQGTLLNKQGRYAEAFEFLHPMLEEIEKEQNAELERVCDLYIQLGNACYYLRDFEKAYAAYQRGYHVSLRLPVFEMRSALAAYHFGMICIELHLDVDAVPHIEQARVYFESVSDLKLMAHAYFYSAIALKNEEFAQMALQLYRGLDALKMVQRVRQYHASYIEAEKDYTAAAEQLYTTALELERLGEKGDALYTLSHAVLLCVEHDDIEQAMRYLSFADSYQERANMKGPYDLALFFRAKAKVAYHMGQFEDCIEYAQRSSDMYDQIGKCIHSADSLEIAVKAYEKKGMHEMACKVYKTVTAKLRSIQRGN